MKMKRYTTPTMAEGLRLIKSELGDGAVILSTRKIKMAGGETGLEITAAVDNFDPPPAIAKPAYAAPVHRPVPERATRNASSLGGMLALHGVSDGVAGRVTRAVDALADTGFSPADALDMVLSKLITFRPASQVLVRGRPMLFLGSTGAGKTTTLAKLAVSQRLAGHTVGLVTLDTYKIGGAEQMRIYGDALKEDPHLATTPAELVAALDSLRSRDYVFIDTAGINPFEPTRRAALADFLSAVRKQGPVDVALVLPANLNAAELAALPRAFGALAPSTLVFSKLDETVHLGGLVNAAVTSELPVCFATDGQRVPQDLLELDAQSLGRRLLVAPRLPWEDAS